MYKYDAISFKWNVGHRFRKFSKKVTKSHSETLMAMMDFFEWHGFSPLEQFEGSIGKAILKNRDRTNAAIAISKSIEKAQNIPLINIETMLASLFQEEVKRKSSKLIETKVSDAILDKNKSKEQSISKLDHERLQRKFSETNDRLSYVLEQIEWVQNRFGKDYLKIEITREELARYKRALKKE